MRTEKQRFMSKVEPITETGCWLWTAGVSEGGYGAFWRAGSMERAHRVSYEMFVGPVPSDKMVLHRCDVPCCVNPSHLFLGTAAQNSADMVAKGRACVGERNGKSKLTPRQIAAIRGSSESQRALADQYGVEQSTISRVTRKELWSHI